MDFQVKAKVKLDGFQDKTEVLNILRSHGFVTDPRKNEVRVKGSFQGLRSAKAELEELLEVQRQTNLDSSSYYPASSGAIPKRRRNGTSVPDRSRSSSGSRNKPTRDAADSSRHRAAYPVGPDEGGSVRNGTNETLAVEGDVFLYADLVRPKEITNVLQRHHVNIRFVEVGESFHITLEGRNSRPAAGELQNFLNGLHAWLRTQEVPFKDLGPEGQGVLRKIHKGPQVYCSVLVRQMKDTLHLIGPSSESYKLKQRLLDPSGDGQGFRGRSLYRSMSLPTIRKKGNSNSGASARPGPGPTAGDSPSKFEDDDWKAEPEPTSRTTRSVSPECERGKERHGRQKKSESKSLKTLFKGWFKKKE